jgi:hypothetical protein
MNLWTWIGVDEPESSVEGGEPAIAELGWPQAVTWARSDADRRAQMPATEASLFVYVDGEAW